MKEEKQITEDITEFIKLSRNSKGYTWEVKVSGLDLEKLNKIREQMESQYGREN